MQKHPNMSELNTHTNTGVVDVMVTINPVIFPHTYLNHLPAKTLFI